MAVGFPAKTNFATGEVLTATNMNDITGTLNLLQSTLYPAGRNKVINGDFRYNQRAFTSTALGGAVAVYGFDRWRGTGQDGTVTYSAQTFTPGTAPVAGYEAANFARIVTTGQTAANSLGLIGQPIEDVKTFAGETVLVSFWAKAAAGTPKIAVELDQQFGSGGSTRVTTYAGQVTISTSWARYSVSVAVPSISGKTIGTSSFICLNLFVSGGSDVNSRTGSMGIQTGTFDFWGVQIEAASTGSTASPFQTASGSIAGELALCQRYYFRFKPEGTTRIGSGFAINTTTAFVTIPYPVTMRVSPTALEQSGTATDYTISNSTTTVCSSVPLFGVANVQSATTQFIVASGLVADQATQARPLISGYLGWSAEL